MKTITKMLTAGIGALALAGALARPVTAQTTPPTTIETHCSTAPAGVARDITLAEDCSLVATHQGDGYKLKVIQQENWTGNFASDKDTFAINLIMPYKGWSFNTGVKFTYEKDRTVKQVSEMATKTFAGQKLSLLGAIADTDVKAGVYVQGTTIDGVVLNIHDKAGKDNLYYSFGAHTPTIGAWFSQNAKEDRSLTFSYDSAVGAYAFGKRRADGTGYVIAQLALDGKQGPVFGTENAQFTSWILADQMPRPNFRNVASYLENGDLTAQLSFNEDKNGEAYTETQFGSTLLSGANGVALRCGAGVRVTDGHTRPVAETYLKLPFGSIPQLPGLKLGLTGRFAQQPDGGIEQTVTLDAAYRF